MTSQQPKKIRFFYRTDNRAAVAWKRKIEKWLRTHYPDVVEVKTGYEALIVLGGDGTFLEASRLCRQSNAVILGLNLGTVGFLAAARKPTEFIGAVKKFFAGNYRVSERTAIDARVVRKKKTVFETTALNELVVFNPLSMVTIEVKVNGHAFQSIAGTGVMVATSTGSTAYNISAHGPVVMPDSHSFILTEILDHSIPTPSLVLDDQYAVDLYVKDFRQRGLLSVTKTGEKVDVLFIADGDVLYPVQPNDVINIVRAPHVVRIVEFEKNYFLKSLQKKFAFK